ncbi:MAG: hypothetical protein H0T84_12115 [Tatlockia sp.]|nr:hypothetical protein [Tatlockia sp.]
MDQMSTIALVVFACAIAVFFSKEFGNSIKKLMSIPGMKLLLPLFLVTFLLVYFEPEVLWCLTKLQAMILVLTQNIASILPFEKFANATAGLLVLMSLTFLPVLAINIWYKRKTYYPLPFAGLTITLIWIFVAVLLAMGLRE